MSGAFLCLFSWGWTGCSSVKRRTDASSIVDGPNGKAISGPVKLLPGMRETTAQDFETSPPVIPTLVPASSPSAVAQADDAAASDDSDSEIVDLDQNAAEEATEDSDDDLESPAKAKAVSKKHEVPFEFNQKVADWIRYFSQNDRERFQRFLDRGEPYRETVENILEENHVPVDLYYLGLIESGFNFRAKSHASAVGVWQFIRSTGRIYGLDVDPYIDERKDPIRATEAAARHLRDLHREFHSWYLAMAAYNAGPGRIRGAVRRGRTDDFWELVRKRVLPRETMDYVPKFLAARYIGENPDLFAFYLNEEKKYPNVELVKVPSPIRFSSIEKICEIPSGTLEFVNPHYLRGYTHPGQKTDEIWVPEEDVKLVQSHFTNLKRAVIHVRSIRSRRKWGVPVYVVRRGDSLFKIAHRRGLSVAYLKRVNGLRSSRVYPGQHLKLSATSYHQKRSHPRRHRRRRRHR